jgi:hypothetical protein
MLVEMREERKTEVRSAVPELQATEGDAQAAAAACSSRAKSPDAAAASPTVKTPDILLKKAADRVSELTSMSVGGAARGEASSSSAKRRRSLSEPRDANPKHAKSPKIQAQDEQHGVPLEAAAASSPMPSPASPLCAEHEKPWPPNPEDIMHSAASVEAFFLYPNQVGVQPKIRLKLI